MRPVIKWDWPQVNGSNKQYSPYGTAKEDLITNLGPYCSFCGERGYFSALDVEHVQPKNYVEGGVKVYAHLEEDWNNFLLGCKNCNPIKGDKKVEPQTHLLPHLDNTFLCFEYLEGGLVRVNPALDNQTKVKAEATLELVGLDRCPGHPMLSDKDKRWFRRLEVWLKAERYLGKYRSGATDLEDVIEIARSNGFWSVWMTVFRDESVVRRALINEFPGTRRSCFDPE
jgi:hypothetical protein